MKKKLLIFLILLFSLLLLSACNGGKKKTTGTGFIGGTEGIAAELAIESTSGGNRIFDTGVDPFRILVTLENRGEHDVIEGNAFITLSGISFEAFSIRDQTQRVEIPLLGLRKEGTGVTDPLQTIVIYDANYKPDAEADRPVDLVADYCYEYQTISRVADLCLKKRVTGPSPESICNIDGEKVAENSGSPVKVNKVIERPAGEQKVNVFLTAENVGPGTIYSPDFLAGGQCTSDEEKKNKIHVKVVLSDFESQSASAVICGGLESNEGEINVINNKVQLSCQIDTSFLAQETAFVTPLRATFSYVYKDSVSTTLTVKSSI